MRLLYTYLVKGLKTPTTKMWILGFYEDSRLKYLSDDFDCEETRIGAPLECIE